ncbi:MAG: AcvB/VirJ family lysyl-phosphatidylglycerol hydrolase [Candidatus Omnitrophota bacterium]
MNCLFILFIFFTIGNAQQATPITDLPLVPIQPDQWKTDYVVILVSGDGGWARIDKRISRYMTDRGIGIVGLDSKKYFWKKKTPEESAKALEQMMEYYSHAWKKDKFVLVGYSRGASVIPFMANRIGKTWKDKIIMLALLGPDKTEDFEIHLLDYVRTRESKNDFPVLPELEKLKDKKILCFCGDEEEDSLCNIVDPAKIKVIRLKGGHHFGGDYEAMAALILNEIRE